MKIFLNSFKANRIMLQFMILGKFMQPKYCLTIGSINVKKSDHVELLGITIDKHLNFKKNIDNLFRDANYKLHALRRIRKYLTIENAKLLGNAFIDSQFNCAPLLQMSCQKTLYLKMEMIHRKKLRIIHHSNAFYPDLLECNDSVSIHH